MIVSTCSSSHPDLNDRFWESAATGYSSTEESVAYFNWPSHLSPKMSYGYDDRSWVVMPIGYGLGLLVDYSVISEMKEIQERAAIFIGGAFYVLLICLFLSVIALFDNWLIGLTGFVGIVAVAAGIFYCSRWLMQRPLNKEFAKQNVGFVEIPEKFYQYLSGKQEVAQKIAEEKRADEFKKMIAGKVVGGVGGLVFGAAFPNAELVKKGFEFIAEKAAEHATEAVIKRG